MRGLQGRFLARRLRTDSSREDARNGRWPRGLPVQSPGTCAHHRSAIARPVHALVVDALPAFSAPFAPFCSHPPIVLSPGNRIATPHPFPLCSIQPQPDAWVVELADTTDLKSVEGNLVRVRVPPQALRETGVCANNYRVNGPLALFATAATRSHLIYPRSGQLSHTRHTRGTQEKQHRARNPGRKLPGTACNPPFARTLPSGVCFHHQRRAFFNCHGHSESTQNPPVWKSLP